MSLEDTYFISQIVAAVAIVASLFYVAVQLRLAQKNQRALMQQGRAARNMAITLRQSEREMAELLTKAISETGWTTMSDVEVTQLTGWARAILFHFEDSYLQHLDGLMEERAFDGARQSLSIIFSRPALRAIWDLNLSFHSPVFAKYADELIHATPLASPRNLTELWKAKMELMTASQEG